MSLGSNSFMKLALLGFGLAFVGCAPDGPKPSSEGPQAATKPTQKDAPPEQAKGGQPVSTGGPQSQQVTPVERVNPKQLIDVVKEEVKGGEASQGPTPLPYLWMPSEEAKIKDEAFTVATPVGLTPITGFVPLANPMTKKKVELGKQLYFDPRVSKDSTVSCATCHNPEKGWTDQLDTSIGIAGQKGGRNAPTVLNTVYGRTMFWDGRAPSLEAQAQGPVQNKIEMGDQSYKEIIERLRTIKGYQEQFLEVFGTEVTLDGMAKAIAAFERTALSGNSKYDKYDRGQDEASLKLLSESEKRGMVLFGLRLRQDDEFDPKVTLKKANCTSCHAGPNFTDEQFHNLGVGWDGKSAKFGDLGRFVIAPIGSKNPAEIAAFKTPTVRDITRTFPYMHDGSEKTLEAVVEYYDRGGNVNPHLDRDMKPLKLTAQEKADLVAFMKALTSEDVKVALPTLPPGPDGKSPDPKAALTPPSPKTAADPHGVIVR